MKEDGDGGSLVGLSSIMDVINESIIGGFSTPAPPSSSGAGILQDDEDCLERTWFNNELLGDDLELCPIETNSTEDDFNTFYFYQVLLLCLL